jgi:hypothetical protein
MLDELAKFLVSSHVLDLGIRRTWVARLTRHREGAPGTHWIGVRVGPRTVLDAAEKNNSFPDFSTVVPVDSRYRKWDEAIGVW